MRIYIHTLLDTPLIGVYICIQKGGAMELETNSRKLLKRLKDEGFEEVSKTGSHLKLRKGDRTVILPHPKKDLPLGTVRSIYRQAGLL
ncbi:type II toxin-antitoxin system HicA family toxin [Paracoccus sp. (in: a-proteobacteria)]|uniref:type II toxin-antitoxin system HicA family toxin n=2 Tax=Paracoccus sp. TaxID=267 RepID=UPI0028B079C5|nr:type II toxin-antitoxin system HicA family toxin [Paracoccus sp. (in: a-proteobacteria)]